MDGSTGFPGINEMLNFYDIACFGSIIIFAAFLLISFIYSIIKNRDKILLYKFLFREDGRISKLNLTFLFTLPIILYQAIHQIDISTGLLELLWAVFAADLGVKGISKWNGHNKLKDKQKEDMFDEENGNTTNY